MTGSGAWQRCVKCAQQNLLKGEAKQSERRVKVGETVKDLDTTIAYGKTETYKADRKLRPMIEGKHSELVHYHGGRRTPYWTLPRVFAGEVWRCLVVNLKRWVKVTTNSPILAAT
ncbi:MAG TPA: transposase [Stenomitos sp.]